MLWTDYSALGVHRLQHMGTCAGTCCVRDKGLHEKTCDHSWYVSHISLIPSPVKHSKQMQTLDEGFTYKSLVLNFKHVLMWPALGDYLIFTSQLKWWMMEFFLMEFFLKEHFRKECVHNHHWMRSEYHVIVAHALVVRKCPYYLFCTRIWFWKSAVQLPMALLKIISLASQFKITVNVS